MTLGTTYIAHLLEKSMKALPKPLSRILCSSGEAGFRQKGPLFGSCEVKNKLLKGG